MHGPEAVYFYSENGPEATFWKQTAEPQNPNAQFCQNVYL